MATKDWRKKTFDDGSFMYVNEKRKGSLYMGERSVAIQIGTVKYGGAELVETRIYEEFESKPQAVKFAKCFMKTENWKKCLGRK